MIAADIKNQEEGRTCRMWKTTRLDYWQIERQQTAGEIESNSPMYRNNTKDSMCNADERGKVKDEMIICIARSHWATTE